MTKSPVRRRHLSNSPFKDPVAPPVKLFHQGDRVNHDRYGLGRIVGVEDGIATLVDFGSRQVRITTPYTGMTTL